MESVTPPAASRSGRRGLDRRVDDVAQLLLKVVIAGGVAFLTLPILIALSMSFDARDYLGQFPPTALSLKWYVRLLLGAVLPARALATSLILAGLCAGIATVLGVATAVGIERSPRAWRDRLTSAFLGAPDRAGGRDRLCPAAVLRPDRHRQRVSAPAGRPCPHHLSLRDPYDFWRRWRASGRPLSEAAQALGATERRAFWDRDVSLDPNRRRGRRGVRLRLFARRRGRQPVPVGSDELHAAGRAGQHDVCEFRSDDRRRRHAVRRQHGPV
ncbi:MAG: hypothetical protein WDO24_04990 [Pseudomonadota bacterium]